MRRSFTFLFRPQGARSFDRLLVFLGGLTSWVTFTFIRYLLGPERAIEITLKRDLSEYKLVALLGQILGIRHPILSFATHYGKLNCRMDASEIAYCLDTHEEVVMRQFKPSHGDVVLDLGANIGVFTVVAARLVGPNGTVIAVEPDPETAAILNQNIRQNHLTNVVLVVAAASSEPGKGRLYRWKGLSGGSSLTNVKERNSKAVDFIEVNLIRMDDLLKDMGKPVVDWIKMDVQWKDLDVLKGLRRTLEKAEGTKLLLEVHPGEIIGQNERSGAAVEAYVRELGFEIQYLEPPSTDNSYHILPSRPLA